MSETIRKLGVRELAALQTEAGRNAYTEARLAGRSEEGAREAAVRAADNVVVSLPGRRCPVCQGSGVRCCEFGADR